LECEGVPVPPSNWMVGQGNITYDEVMLIGIVHVSEGSCLPILQLTRRVVLWTSLLNVSRRRHISSTV